MAKNASKNSATVARDAALDLLEEHRSNYLSEARIVAKRLYKRKKHPVTVDDVRKHLPPPEYVDPRVMGAIFRTPEWKKVGMVNSQRVTCHGRPISYFEPS